MHQLPLDIINQKKNFFLFLLLIFCGQIIVSCRQKNLENEKNYFKASIDLISYKDNTIQLFYKKKADDRYFEEFSLKKRIKGSTFLQHLIFELPYGIRPKNIRIDLGENENENDSIKIENIRFQYKNCIINGDNGVYKSWFFFNGNLIKGKDSLTFHLKKINTVFDPQLNGNQILNSKLAKLFPPDINEF